MIFQPTPSGKKIAGNSVELEFDLNRFASGDAPFVLTTTPPVEPFDKNFYSSTEVLQMIQRLGLKKITELSDASSTSSSSTSGSSSSTVSSTASGTFSCKNLIRKYSSIAKASDDAEIPYGKRASSIDIEIPFEKNDFSFSNPFRIFDALQDLSFFDDGSGNMELIASDEDYVPEWAESYLTNRKIPKNRFEDFLKETLKRN